LNTLAGVCVRKDPPNENGNRSRLAAKLKARQLAGPESIGAD
jgi:hypothetical protein